MKTSELTGAALDYAVAKCEGGTDFYFDSVATYWIKINDKNMALSTGWADSMNYAPSRDWRAGGPIIEKEKIHVCPIVLDSFAAFQCWVEKHNSSKFDGETPLIAAMRAYVASKLGDEVDVPSELLK